MNQLVSAYFNGFVSIQSSFVNHYSNSSYKMLSILQSLTDLFQHKPAGKEGQEEASLLPEQENKRNHK